jgi:hypothetical protein
MTPSSLRALALARPGLQALTLLNLLDVTFLVLLFGSSFVAADWPQAPLGIDLAHLHPFAPLGLRAIFVIGLAGAAIVHTILRRVTVANLSLLKTGKAKTMRFSTLEAICIALECQPGELLAIDPLPVPPD